MATSTTGGSASAGPSGTSGTAKTRKPRTPKPKTVEVEGVVLLLPDTVPLRILKQMIEIAEAGEDARMKDMVDALETVLGEEQMETVWGMDVNAGNGTLDSLQDLFAEIIDKVFVASGITPGESKASPSP